MRKVFISGKKFDENVDGRSLAIGERFLNIHHKCYGNKGDFSIDFIQNNCFDDNLVLNVKTNNNEMKIVISTNDDGNIIVDVY